MDTAPKQVHEGELVSVIIPAYNAERYISQAIESVLAQTYQWLDVIVVDDGSEDGSADVVREYAPHVRYHRHTNRGAGATRNEGVALARGSLLSFLDADDLWTKDKLRQQVKILYERPDLDAVFGHADQFYSPELKDQLKTEVRCPTEPIAGYIPGTMLIRKPAFLRVGQFRTERAVGEFIDWFMRAQELKLQVEMMPDVTTRRRIHDANQGLRYDRAAADYSSILKAAIDRRRRAKA